MQQLLIVLGILRMWDWVSTPDFQVVDGFLAVSRGSHNFVSMFGWCALPRNELVSARASQDLRCAKGEATRWEGGGPSHRGTGFDLSN